MAGLEDWKAYIFQELSALNDSVKSTRVKSETADALLQSVNGLEGQFREMVKDIFVHNAEEPDPKKKVGTKDFPTFEGLINNIRKLCYKAKQDVDSSSSKVASTSSPSLKMPKIELPKFNGDLGEWYSFKAQYDNVVHSQKGYTGIQKFCYLRSYLAKEALAIVDQYEQTDANYQLAYDALVDRYDNSRLQAAHYLRKIFSYGQSGKTTCHSQYLEVHKAATAALKRLNVTDLSDYILFELSYRNLSSQQQKLFDREQDPKTIPTLKDLFTFVEATARAEELQNASISVTKDFKEKPKAQKSLTVTKGADLKKLQCVHCKGEHRLYHCASFKDEPHQRKLDIVRLTNVCVKCLGQHKAGCNSIYNCRICKSKAHHSLLCKDGESEPEQQKKVEPIQTCTSCTSSNWAGVMLSTVRCVAMDQWGKRHPVRLVLDSGSQLNIVSDAFARQLGLPRFTSPFNVEGVDKKGTRPQGAVKLKLVSGLDSSIEYTCTAVVLDSICSELPSQTMDPSAVQQIQSLSIPLADEKFYERGPVDILLGGGAYMDLLSNEQPSLMKIQDGLPGAIRTKFGFIVLGHVKPTALNLLVKADPIEQALRKFWEYEEVETSVPEDPDSVKCEEHFKATHSRCENGQYMVRLKFREDAPPMGSNRTSAIGSFLRLEKRLSKQPDLAGSYSSVIDDYLKQGHLSRADTTSEYLLPHHCVIKDSSTTKVRVVFSANALDDKGVSLNDRLLAGAVPYNDLADILLSFRFHEVALCADIRQMYRMIWLHPEDRQYQHILWRGEDGQVHEYSLNTVTFGVSSSPYLALRVVQQLLEDEGAHYPEATTALKRHRFMDDIVSGTSSVKDAVQLRQDMSELLAKGGFELRKWACNKSEVLQGVMEEEKEKLVPFDTGEGLKVLGLYWDPAKDCFSYKVAEYDSKGVTRRSVLSYISRIWDCMGLLSAVTVKAKIFLQRLWLEKRGWDEEIAPQLSNEWLHFCSEMPLLRSLSVTRNIPLQAARTVRLVGFSDAAETAMAANVYMHLTYQDGSSEAFLIRSRTRLSPIRTVTIPRLELGAAVLLAKTIKTVLLGTDINFESVDLFTDSQIVLFWLRTPPYKMKVYIASRVIQILDGVPEARWGFISGKLNPADISSRGIDPSQLQNCDLWWKGPPMLTSDPSTWHSEPLRAPGADEELEMKKENPVPVLTVQVIEEPDFLTRYSSLSKAIRVRTTVRRIATYWAGKHKRTGPLTVEELQATMQEFVLVTQQLYLSDVAAALRSGKAVPTKYLNLNPRLDSAGVIRVGGRLQNADVPSAAKEPMLIPRESKLAVLLCDYYHHKYLHSGPRATYAAIVQVYWIPSGYQLVKKTIRKCLICYKLRAKPQQPKMAPLPEPRVQVSRPFTSTAVDFSGAMTTKETTRKKSPQHKSYICAFVCLSTKAVHLELVSELTTAAFMASFNRFVSRRGLPHTMYSDNGTNFVGAARVMEQSRDFLAKFTNDVVSCVASLNVRWLFSPPMASNFNGLVEAVIKSSKQLVLRQIGADVLTFEEATTLLCRVEAVLNSRPLTPLSSEPGEAPNFLTPASFLVGSDLLAVPEFPSEELSLRNRWERVQRLSQSFWRKFSIQYLHTLQKRTKWGKDVDNIQVGNLVYIKDMNSTPLQWPLAKVIKVYPGKDNRVRVAVVRCKGKDVTRPANKLVLLPDEPLAPVPDE